VVGAVEIFRDDDVCDVIPGCGIQEQAAENGLLRFDRVRRLRRIRQRQ